jgi:membrane associated rhomboid family serine protease
MFVHGGFMHIGSNMLYLWIFGNNVEDAMGRVRFTVFYFISGVAATLVHVLADPDSTVPMIGASGAIAGVLGAYFVLYPHARIKTLVILIFIVQIVYIPAVLLLGFWLLMQILNLGGGGGVAWYAHIGGFLAGMLLVRRFERPRPRRIWIDPRGEW